MRIVLSNSAGIPIYEQIADQIVEAILSGDVKEGELLPSIRALAKDLKISVITTTRAYAELEQGGFVDNVQGKGCFVRAQNTELVREQLLRKVEAGLQNAIEAAKTARMSKQELLDTFEILYKEEEQP